MGIDGQRYSSGCGPRGCEQPSGPCCESCQGEVVRNCECPVNAPIWNNGRCFAEAKCKKLETCDKFENQDSKSSCDKRVANANRQRCSKRSFWRKCKQSCCEAGFLPPRR